MPQRTKGGLRPTHQPCTTVYHNCEPNIINVLMQMKSDNKSDYTIKFTNKALTYLSKHTSLSEPEAVKMLISTLKTSDSYKKNLCIAYNRYCKHCKIQWNMPKYTQEAKNVALPTREKLLMLISNAEKLLSMKLQLSMETGIRPVELSRLKAKDIDLDHKTVNPTTAKNGNPRTLPMTANLTTKIQEHIIRKNLNPNDQLFTGLDPDHYGKQYRMMRNKLAQKLKDPAIHTIRLYDFRHYFCTATLHKTKDPFYTMIQMGHKKLTTTQKYMHLLDLNDDEWTCKTANNIKEATALIEAGFEYITEIDGTKLFRKRK